MVKRSKQQAFSFFTLTITVVQDSSLSQSPLYKTNIFWRKKNLIKSNILQQDDWSITEDLHFDNEEVKDDKSNPLLTSIIEFIQRTERFQSRWFNRFNWHLLYKAFNSNLLPAIKQTDYCITSSTFHLHIYFCCCDDL